MPIEIKAYKCQHCRKIYVRLFAAERHEDLCKKNPENMPACWNCKHLGKDKMPDIMCYDECGCPDIEAQGIPFYTCAGLRHHDMMYGPLTRKKHDRHVANHTNTDQWDKFFEEARPMPMMCLEYLEDVP